MKKIAAFASFLAVTACAGPPPPQSFATLTYGYLKPIVFKVSTLKVVNNYTPTPAETQLNAENPAPPAATLMAMLKRRLLPSGAPGAGTVTVQVASINEVNGKLTGQMTVDVKLASPGGRSTGFAEASVSASTAEPDADAGPDAQRAALYAMTKKLMTLMNVELPYQIVHNIPNWVSWTNPQGSMVPGGGAASGAIETAPLTSPGTAGPQTPPPAPGTNAAAPHYLPGAGPAAPSPAQ